MKTNPNKATPRVYHTLRQIVQRVPRWLIEKTANAYGVEARKFSATSHFVMLILGHLSRASCLTEICDDADLNKRKLSLVRNATPGKRNTLIKLALSCIASCPYRSKKAAAKMHTRLPVGSFIPSVVCVEVGKPHDSTMADELTKDMKGQTLLYHVELLRNSDG